MLDLELIRRDPELVRRALGSRYGEVALEPILELDARRREYVHKADGLRARRNQVSNEMRLLHVEMGKTDTPATRKPLKASDKEIISMDVSSKQMLEKAETFRKEMRYVGEQISQLGTEVKNIQQELETLLLALPNIPNSDIPIGADESANVTVRSWSNPSKFDFEPKTHWDLNENLKIIDFHRGVKLSGSRFYALHGMGAKLQRALISWMLDLHTKEHGYTEVYLPALVRQEVMEGSGNLPKFIDNLYRDQEDDLWLIPSAEVPLTGLHREEILNPGTLPLYYAAYTPCFRREKAAAGRDTRGIKRVHQFDKVELYMFVPPERSNQELERLVSHAEEVLQRLDIAYRVTQLCTGDLGFQSAKTYDIEAWAPGCQEWLEVSSCSNCTDFQARRSNIKFRREARGRPEFVHTINGSGLAVPRVMIAILERYQQADGSVIIPAVLQPYMQMDVITPSGFD